MQIKKTQLTKQQIRTTLLIILIVVITGASITLALLSTKIYKNSAADKTQKTLYSASMYFAEQIRQCENNSQVRIATLGGKIPALVLSSENHDNEGSYETWFFTYDGQLCKIKTKPGNTVVPYSGTPVMPLGNVDFHLLQSDLLEVTIITQTGENTTVNLHLAGNGGNTDE